MLIGGIIMGIIGWMIMPSFLALTKSSYDRKGIESICEEMFGNVKI